MSMFNDFRDDDNKTPSPFYEEDQSLFEDEKPKAASRAGAPKAKTARKSGGFKFELIDSKGRILGMTAMQRFILSALLLMVVCVLGSMFMIVIGAFYI